MDIYFDVIDAPLPERKLEKLNSLVFEGNHLIDQLSSSHTYDEIKKMVSSFVDKVYKNYKIIEQAGSLDPKPVAQFISNVKKLVLVLKNIKSFIDIKDTLFDNLKKFLANYKIFLNFNYKINFRLSNSTVTKKTITLSFDDLSVDKVVLLILKNNEDFIRENFLFTEHSKILASIFLELLEVYHSFLDKWLNTTSNQDFALKLFAVLKSILEESKKLPDKLFTLSLSYLNSFSKKLSSVADIIEKSKSLINIEFSNRYIEVLRDSNTILAYLRKTSTIKDLPEELAKDFLDLHGFYNEIDVVDKEKYEIFKKLFSSL